ncbi:uncharacterized protein LOC142356142, partial [Convolutriloba macropyga]|uniref:uncharacterized protein LOC142356142 n=1 Tax=Convolutriloba macropyga TaxID=536237 RepID=UPI003F51BFED
DCGPGRGTFDVRQWIAKKGRNAEQLHVSQPYQVACWTKTSINEGRAILYGDKSGLHEYREPALPCDLNSGYPESFIRKPPNDHSPVEQVAKALLSAKVPWKDADVITFRNNLNKISMTVLNKRDEWIIHGCMRDSAGPLFLDIHPREEAEEPSYPNSDRFMYYGYKFEQLCTDTSTSSQSGSATVDSTSEFAAVVRLRIGNLRVMMGAEMDCQIPQTSRNSQDLSSYIELKTAKTPTNQRQRNSLLRFKYPRWWMQSWFAGVTRLAVGNRDEQGMLHTIEVLKTTDLPNIAKREGVQWNPWEFINFTNDVLLWMKQQAQASPGKQLTFRYNPGVQGITSEVAADGGLEQRVVGMMSGD